MNVFRTWLFQPSSGTHTKDNEARRVPINILKILKKILENAEFVFTHRGMRIKGIRTGLMAACKTAGVKHGRAVKNGLTVHDLRHTV